MPQDVVLVAQALEAHHDGADLVGAGVRHLDAVHLGNEQGRKKVNISCMYLILSIKITFDLSVAIVASREIKIEEVQSNWQF